MVAEAAARARLHALSESEANSRREITCADREFFLVRRTQRQSAGAGAGAARAMLKSSASRESVRRATALSATVTAIAADHADERQPLEQPLRHNNAARAPTGRRNASDQLGGPPRDPSGFQLRLT